MNRILLLTENIYIEADFQKRLQNLNYEVFLSGSLFDGWRKEKELCQLMDIFQIIIVSETIANNDAEALAAYFTEQPIVLIRKTEQLPTEQLEKKWDTAGFIGWINNDLPMEELREKMFQYRDTGLSRKLKQIQGSPEAAIANLRLSNTEEKLLKILLENKSEVVSRRDISLSLWEVEPNPSILSQISYKIGQIKHKIEQSYGISSAIVTDWRKGYHLNPEFVQQIEGNIF